MDQRKLEQFAERLLNETNAAMSCLNIWLGYRLGLFRVLADNDGLTPKELATQTGCSERYVREWLECMTAGGYIVQQSIEGPFSLPPEHAAVLADHDHALFALPFVCFIPNLAGALPQLEDAFRTGGGVPFEAYGGGAREVIEESNRTMFINDYVKKWLPMLPDIAERLEAGGRVVEVGCGAGWSSIALAKGFPRARIDAIDADPASIEEARCNAKQAGVSAQIRFICSAIEGVSMRNGYDLVTAFECIHMMAHPVQALRVMRRLVSSNGAVLVAEKAVEDTLEENCSFIGHLSYNLSVLHCLPQAMLFQDTAGTGGLLGPSKLERYSGDAGFSKIETLPIENSLLRFYRLTSTS